MAQTAVEWLIDQVQDFFVIPFDVLEQAKEIEKQREQKHEQQIKDAYVDGQKNGYEYRDGGVSLIDGEECRVDLIDAEEYYNEQFKK